MTVRELIDRLLSEPMDAKVMIQTYEGDRKTIKGSDGEETSVEWRIWSAILIERTAFKHDVYDAPSVEPKRKRGRWLNHLGLPLNDFCSVCAKDSPYNKHWDFCPNCGADMRGEEQ